MAKRPFTVPRDEQPTFAQAFATISEADVKRANNRKTLKEYLKRNRVLRDVVEAR